MGKVGIILIKKNLYYVLNTLEEGPKSLNAISQETGIRFEHVIKYIKELIQKKLCRKLNSKCNERQSIWYNQ
ncbi:MAG: hypothetical protein ACFFD2_18215 [Promethearchaeota archaeon]